MRLELLASTIERFHLRFALLHGDFVVEHQIQQLLDAPADPLDLAPRRGEPGALLHPEPIHLLREFAAELLEEVLAHQLVLERPENPRLNLLTRNRQSVLTRAATASTEASKVLARVDDEASAADAAFRQAGEQILGSSELIESFGPAPLSLDRCVSISYRLPKLVVQDSQIGYVLRDPLGLRIRPGDAPAGVRIFEESLAIPHQAPNVQLVMKNADPAFWVSVNRAGTPQRTLRTWDAFLVERLRDLLRRRACGVVAVDPANNGSFVCVDLAFPGSDGAVFQPPHDAVPVAQTATRLASLDASAQASPRLVRELLEEHRVHRSLESDMQERDVALGERDDADAGESESLEQAGGVLLVAAESIERFGENDVDLFAKRRLHHCLEA